MKTVPAFADGNGSSGSAALAEPAIAAAVTSTAASAVSALIVPPYLLLEGAGQLHAERAAVPVVDAGEPDRALRLRELAGDLRHLEGALDGEGVATLVAAAARALRDGEGDDASADGDRAGAAERGARLLRRVRRCPAADDLAGAPRDASLPVPFAAIVAVLPSTFVEAV